MIEHIASRLVSLPTWLALLLVVALPALEASIFLGFVVPGEIALILGGGVLYRRLRRGEG